MADVTVLTTVGEEVIVEALAGLSAATQIKYIDWGEGATEAAKGASAIETPAARAARATGTVTHVTASIYQVVGTLTATEDQTSDTIKNAGVFNDVTAGTLVIYSSFTGIPLAIGDSIQFTFTLEIQ
jgi:hypothetical protein